MGILSKYKDVTKEENDNIRLYFNNCIETINDNNLYMLRKVCMYISMIYVGMLIIGLTVLPDLELSWPHFLIIPLMLVYFNINLYAIKHRGNISTGKTAAICCSFYFCLGVIIALLDTVVAPAGQAIWMPIAVILLPVMFIDRIYKYGFEEFVVLAILLVCSYIFKDKERFIRDVYIAISAYVTSMLSGRIVLVMRSRESLAMAEVTRLSSLDKLTHVLNKGALLQKIENYFLQKQADEPCAMCIIDLDDFKHVNDNLGHNTGDSLLEQVGKLLNENFRAYDIIGRYGGDEFVVVMPRMGDISILQSRCRTLQMYIKELYFGNEQPFTVSIGAVISRNVRDSSKVFAMADNALYKSKIQGKDYCTTWIYEEEDIDEPILISISSEEHEGIKKLKDEEGERFHILTANNDEDALKYISQYATQIKLIHLEMNDELGLGVFVLKYLKSREGFAKIPVLAVVKSDRAEKTALEFKADNVIRFGTPDAVYKKAINELIGM